MCQSNCNDYYNNLLDNNSYLTTQQKVHLIQSKFPDRFFWQINSIITKAKTQQSLENIARHWTSGSEETEETIEPAHLKNKKTSTHNTKSQPLIKKQILPTISEETENLAKKFKNNRKSIKYINEKIHRFFYNDKRLYESIVFKDNQIDFLKLLENDTFLNNIYLSKLSKLKKVKTY